MHRLSSHTVGTSLAITVGILYALCALAYVVAPKITGDLFVLMMHGVNVRSLLTVISFWPTIGGLVVTVVYSYIAGALFAGVWNKLVGSSTQQ